MERLIPEIEQLFRAKERRRARLAAMPFPEKVRADVQMQKMAASIVARQRSAGADMGVEVDR